MKTIFFIATLLIATSAFVQGTPSGTGIKDLVKDKFEVKTKPDEVLIINIDHLRRQTADISLLKPVFMIIDAIENATSKVHGRKIKICCNKSEN